MAEPLKNSYGPEIAVRIADMIAAVHPTFPSAAFLADALDGYEELELTPRARQIAAALAAHLPARFIDAAPVLVASLGPPIEGDELEGQGMAPFVYLPHVFYVAQAGTEDWETAMWAQHELTRRFTCEFSIRVFIEREPERTMARLREWTADASPHVRRLVSEGTRPRLPWAPRLRRFQDDPGPVVELLELLRDDPTTLVRRSVANNLNDIGKDHPAVLIDVCRRWMVDATTQRKSLVRHALRSAVRRGDVDALEILGFHERHHASIEQVEIGPAVATIGGRVRVGFTVANTGEVPEAYNVDLRIHFVKANGSTSPKVFKVRTIELEPGERADLAKSVSIAQQTTRTHYPGVHAVDVVVNGTVGPAGSFTVVDGSDEETRG